MVTPLVVHIDPGLGAPPTSFNQGVLISPTISVITNTGTVPPFENPNLGTIQGTITTNATGGFTTSTRPTSITANLAGTDNIVETETLPNSCNGKTTCEFILYLPAAAAVFGGTNYDLVASGKGASFAVRGDVNVISGLNTDLRAKPLAIKTKTTLMLTGKVNDLCTGVGVQAATLDLLVPDATLSPVPDCSVLPRPAQCVVAFSAATDEAGTFPLPGNGFNPAPFNSVPLPDAGAPYELVTTAAGFDRTPVTITANGSVFKCTPTAKSGACVVDLSHGAVTGSVALGSGSGPLSVLVTAEDSGTNNIENMALVTIPDGANSVPYTMNVPDTANIGERGPVTLLDFFASTQDLFNSAPQQATGHSIAVAAQIAAPSACSSSPATGPDLSGMTCVGHGSVAGTVTIPVSTDTVVLSKMDPSNIPVQIESTGIEAPGSPGAGGFSLCAPADPLPYALTRFQGAPVSTPVGTPLPVKLNPPIIAAPGATPCPGICQIPGNPGACQTCTATQAPSAL